ncbi:hypothetical protein [Tenacibaculum sp.]|uniref:hypothetical protein n=1 Tax=Tenacibaculum sp. TaxID=1906242 RepID=UPI003D0F29FA
MKNLFYLLFISFVLLTSCSDENINDLKDTPQTTEAPSKDYSYKTTCDITGNSCVFPNSTNTYTYTSNFNNSNINWSVLSGDITIKSGQGTKTITLEFGINFQGGEITAQGSDNGTLTCSDNFVISKCSGCNPTTEVNIEQTKGACSGDVFTFEAEPNGSSYSGTYQWNATNGAYIISGQGTRIIKIQSPNTGGFAVSVSHTNNCDNSTVSRFTLAEFSAGCGGFGF